MKIYFKEGIKISGIDYMLLRAILIISDLFSELSITLTITSVMDGVHKSNSLHYEGNAIDIRSFSIPIKFRKDIAKWISNKLGVHYDVIDESDHIHIEYDPK